MFTTHVVQFSNLTGFTVLPGQWHVNVARDWLVYYKLRLYHVILILFGWRNLRCWKIYFSRSYTVPVITKVRFIQTRDRLHNSVLLIEDVEGTGCTKVFCWLKMLQFPCFTNDCHSQITDTFVSLAVFFFWWYTWNYSGLVCWKLGFQDFDNLVRENKASSNRNKASCVCSCQRI